MEEKKNTIKVAVIGSGIMGSGIAQVFALHGHSVNLFNYSKSSLDTSIKNTDENLERQVKRSRIDSNEKDKILERIKLFTDLESAVNDVDLVIEAVPEIESIKLELFKSLDTYCLDNTILASNTSSISISRIANATSRPDRVIGMHFMNPVPLMKLVEIVKGKGTSQETINMVEELAIELGKTPVIVNDSPGFVANRILIPMINEAIYTLEEGVAGVEEIDKIMKLGMYHPMGPLQLADFIGLDVCLFILEVMHKELNNVKYKPCNLLVKMVEDKKLGRKNKIGFYDWNEGDKNISVYKNN